MWEALQADLLLSGRQSDDQESCSEEFIEINTKEKAKKSNRKTTRNEGAVAFLVSLTTNLLVTHRLRIDQLQRQRQGWRINLLDPVDGQRCPRYGIVIQQLASLRINTLYHRGFLESNTHRLQTNRGSVL